MRTSKPEDVGEGGQEGPQDDVLQYQDNADGQVLLPWLVDEEQGQQYGGDARHDVAAHAKHELAHQPQLAAVVQTLLHRLHRIRVIVCTRTSVIDWYSSRQHMQRVQTLTQSCQVHSTSARRSRMHIHACNLIASSSLTGDFSVVV